MPRLTLAVDNYVQVNAKLDQLAPAAPKPEAPAAAAGGEGGAAAAPAEGGEQMDTDAADQAAPAAAAGQAAEAEASPFSKRLALFKVRWSDGGADATHPCAQDLGAMYLRCCMGVAG